jgi:lysozyme
VVLPLGVLAVLVLIGLGIYTLWLPHYRPSVHDDEVYGIDISNHQGEIDWSKVGEGDVDFAYIKASEGGDYVDEWFNENWAGAEAAGLQRGAYHFFTLCRPGAEQAANFLRTVPSAPSDLPMSVDLELAGNCADRPDAEWVDRELGVFLEQVEAATGKPVLLYVGDDFEGIYPVRRTLDRPVWFRSIIFRPSNPDWAVWQVHDRADVPGIEGGVDLNVGKVEFVGRADR